MWIHAAIVMSSMEKVRALFESGLLAQGDLH